MATVNSFKEYYAMVQNRLVKARDDAELFKEIVDAPFHNKLHTTSFDLGMIVLVLANPKTKMIDRITYSQTAPAQDAVKASPIEFNKIKIPLKNRDNITAKAIRNSKYYQTSDWCHLFVPALSAEAARFNQAEAGMGCSVVYPLVNTRNGGALIFSFYQTLDMITAKHHTFMQNYSNFVSARLR